VGSGGVPGVMGNGGGSG